MKRNEVLMVVRTTKLDARPTAASDITQYVRQVLKHRLNTVTVRQASPTEVVALSGANPAVEAIKYALTQTEGKEFLHAWMVGDWEDIRREWPDAPEAVFVQPATLGKKPRR